MLRDQHSPGEQGRRIELGGHRDPFQTGRDGERELRVSEELWGPVTMYVKLPEGVTCRQLTVHHAGDDMMT